jgi:hypothetical protein
VTVARPAKGLHELNVELRPAVGRAFIWLFEVTGRLAC